MFPGSYTSLSGKNANEALQGVDATSDSALKTGDHILQKHRKQPTEVGRKKRYNLRQEQFTFNFTCFFDSGTGLSLTKEATDGVVNKRHQLSKSYV